MTRLIALSGYRGSGKDTSAEYMHKRYKFIPVSFAKKLKDMVASIYNISREDLDDTSRKEMPLMQYPAISTDSFTQAIHHKLTDELKSGYWTPRALCILEGSSKRAVHSNFWVRQVMSEVLENPQNRYVITDMRYKSEADTLKMLLPSVQFLRIERPSVVLTTQDPSERDLDDYPFSTRISNHGTHEDLGNTLDLALNHLGIWAPREVR